MVRVKRGKIHTKRRRNILKKTKGYRWRRKKTIKAAKEAFLKAGQYAFRDRRKKKGQFRRLWNLRINIASRQKGISYSRFIKALKDNKIELDRKILSDLAVNNPEIFKKIVEKVHPHTNL